MPARRPRRAAPRAGRPRSSPQERLLERLQSLESALEAQAEEATIDELPLLLAEIPRISDAWLFTRLTSAVAAGLVRLADSYPERRRRQLAEQAATVMRFAPRDLPAEERRALSLALAILLCELDAWEPSIPLFETALAPGGEQDEWRNGSRERLPYARALQNTERWEQARAVLEDLPEELGGELETELGRLELLSEQALHDEDGEASSRYAEKAAEIALGSGRPDVAVDYLEDAAANHPDPAAAVRLATQALALTDGSVDPGHRGTAALAIGMAATETQPDLARAQLRRALAAARAARDPFAMVGAATTLATLCEGEELLEVLSCIPEALDRLGVPDLQLDPPDEEEELPALEGLSALAVGIVTSRLADVPQGDRAMLLQQFWDAVPPGMPELSNPILDAARAAGVELDLFDGGDGSDGFDEGTDDIPF